MATEICKFKEILGIPFRYNNCCAYLSIENPICWEKMQDVAAEAEAYLDSLVLGLFSRPATRQEDDQDALQILARALVCGKAHAHVAPSSGGTFCQHSYIAWTFQERLNNWRRRHDEADIFYKEEETIAPKSEVCDITSALGTLSLVAQQEEQPNPRPRRPAPHVLQHLPKTPSRPRQRKPAVELEDVFSTPAVWPDDNRLRSRSSSRAAAVEDCTTSRLQNPILSSSATTPSSYKGSPLFSPGSCDLPELNSSSKEATTPMTDYSTDNSHVKSKKSHSRLGKNHEEEPSPTKRKGQTARGGARRSDPKNRGGRGKTKSQLSGAIEIPDDEATSTPAPPPKSVEARAKADMKAFKGPRRDSIRFTVAKDPKFEKGVECVSDTRKGGDRIDTDIPSNLSSFELIKFLREIVSDNNHRHGYVYCFADKASPGYLKIGSATLPKERDFVTHPISHPPESDDYLWTRLRNQITTCNFELELKFVVFMPCAVVRMEQLIHRTLIKEKRYVESGNCRGLACKRRHREWFETTVDEALDIVKKWGAFSRLIPYVENGRPEKLWSDYAERRCKEFPDLTGKQWVNQHLVKLTELEWQRREAMHMAWNLLNYNKRLSKKWEEYRKGIEELGGNPFLREEDRGIDELTEMYSWYYGSLGLG